MAASLGRDRFGSLVLLALAAAVSGISFESVLEVDALILGARQGGRHYARNRWLLFLGGDRNP